MAVQVPTFVVDYPEAQVTLARLRARFDVEAAGVFPALGAAPVSRNMKPHAVPAEPFIVVNGSGNYHHETVPLLEGFLEARPEGRFSYIQVDAHPDKTERFRWRCECGTFVGRILANPRIDNVHLVGLNLPCLLDAGDTTLYTRHLSYYGCDYFGKLRQYVAAGEDLDELFWHFEEEDLAQARENPSVASVERTEAPPPPAQRSVPAALRDTTPEPALRVRWRGLSAFDPEALPDLPVYLSIDLDVSRELPVTDWRERFEQQTNRFGVLDNQGIVEWPEVLELVRRIGAARPVAAADVCGLTEHLDELSDHAREASLTAMEEIYEALHEAVSRSR